MSDTLHSINNEENVKKVVQSVERFVKKRLADEGTGHDWWHVKRVRDNAVCIAESANADLFVVELAALLHDVADHKFHDESVAPRLIRECLTERVVSEDVIDHVVKIVENMSWSKGDNDNFDSEEMRIVQDADRLDAMGAIGIARTFAYGGYKERPIYSPDMEDGQDSIQHFHEKLLKLRDSMHTDFARKIAEKRHRYMQDFLNQFHDEWNPSW